MSGCEANGAKFFMMMIMMILTIEPCPLPAKEGVSIAPESPPFHVVALVSDDIMQLLKLFGHKSEILLERILNGLCADKLVPMLIFLYILALSAPMFVVCSSQFSLLQNQKHPSHPEAMPGF